tara:strand:+ start:737 stop:2131 length:1395 start_codon:yes stop_codon:yes gene_type:complete
MSLHIVILAAGLGKRMLSETPKVLHKLAGKPMLTQVVETAQSLNPEQIHIVVGHGNAQVKKALSSLAVNWVQQDKQLGTGHAVMQALPDIPEQSQVMVLSADVPLIQAQTLQALQSCCTPKPQQPIPLGLLLARAPDPTGLGRIIRDDNGNITAIVEEKDASEQQRQINEIYSGICCANTADLQRWLPRLSSNNAQQEYYLTEIIAIACEEGIPVHSIHAHDYMEIQGVNNRLQLQQLERAFQTRQANDLMLSGVTLADAQRIDIRGTLNCERDVFIDVNAVFEGEVTLAKGCQIGANCTLKNVTLGAGCIILPNSVLENCHIEQNCQIGPFARIRPGTRLAADCKIGNFVETKNAVFQAGSKASHLSYLGDVQIGKNVNIGAGTITCNYDGANKHTTVIEDGAFIGSDTQLVAPVTVGKNATIGAGSTIRKDAPAESLTLTASKQRTIYEWKRPVEKNTKTPA